MSVRPNDFNSPHSIYLNSNMTPRHSGRFSKFGLVFFVLQYSSQMLKHLCDFPLPNVDLEFAVISVLQNTHCSTLGREKGHFSKETCVRSKPREFSRNSGEMVSVSTTICDEYCLCV